MEIFTKRSVGSGANASGPLRLCISGFGQQNTVDVRQIVAAIDILPNHHLVGLRDIVYAPFGMPSESPHVFWDRPPPTRRGEFQQKQRRIVIYAIESSDLFYHVLYHEIGHFVFFLALNSRVKKRWVTAIFPQSQCVTPYGTLNASEDFAESYACYVREPERLQLFPAKFDYMRNWVFSGRMDSLKEKN
jgi:hypothetical protein